MFDHILLELVFICLYGNGSLSIFGRFSGICIFIFGTVIISFTLLLYLMALEFSIVHRPHPIQLKLTSVTTQSPSFVSHMEQFI